MLTLTDCPRRSSQTAADSLEGQTIIIDLKSGVYFSLNATGTFLWDRLDGETSLASISRELAAAYEVDAETTDADILELAGQLHSEGLIIL
ncbi:MAG: PqqD family protein [Caldilineales bacterium]|nr:PqqD family protein [Caldilineales bacterium]